MSQTDELNPELAALRREIEDLRAELTALKQALGVPSGEALRERRGLLSLRCASVEVLDDEGTPVVRLSAGEAGGELQLRATASDTARAVMIATREGANLALCGRDGTPRAVLQSRDEGGGASFIDENGDLAAEVWGASEASWLSLLHEGRPAVVSVAAPQGGNVQVFDASDAVLAALPPNAPPLHSPE